MSKRVDTRGIMEEESVATEDSPNVSGSSIAPISNTQESDGTVHSIELFNARACRCGCIPAGMLSLFEMAEKRKEFNRRKKESETKGKEK